MPNETRSAIEWALTQPGITVDTPHDLVDAVRQWLNAHGIPYDTFSYDDLIPHLT